MWHKDMHAHIHTHHLLVWKQSSAHSLWVGAVRGLRPGHRGVVWAAMLGGCMALDQGAVAGVGEGTGGGWQGHARSPRTLELCVTRCGRGVVWGRWRREGRVEACYSFQLCEHAIHGWTAVYPTTTHLAQGQYWTLISKPFIWEELVWILQVKNKNHKSHPPEISSSLTLGTRSAFCLPAVAQWLRLPDQTPSAPAAAAHSWRWLPRHSWGHTLSEPALCVLAHAASESSPLPQITEALKSEKEYKVRHQSKMTWVS